MNRARISPDQSCRLCTLLFLIVATWAGVLGIIAWVVSALGGAS